MPAPKGHPYWRKPYRETPERYSDFIKMCIKRYGVPYYDLPNKIEPVPETNRGLARIGPPGYYFRIVDGIYELCYVTYWKKIYKVCSKSNGPSKYSRNGVKNQQIVDTLRRTTHWIEINWIKGPPRHYYKHGWEHYKTWKDLECLSYEIRQWLQKVGPNENEGRIDI